MLAKEIMTADIINVMPETPIKEAARQMALHNVGALPVYDGNKIHGIVTDRDLTTRALAEGADANTTKVSDVMTNHCVTCSENTAVEKAVKLMEKNAVRRLVVTKDGDADAPVGIFSLDDIARKSNDPKLSGRAFLRLNKKPRRLAS